MASEISTDSSLLNENQHSIKIDFNHPLFLHPSDTPSTILVSELLIGTENYALWSRSMKIALLAKNKQAFINGFCRKENYENSLHDQWERCNAIVLSWIMNSVSKNLLGGIVYSSNSYQVWQDLKERFDRINGSRIYFLHREIATLNQGTLSVSNYFTKLKLLWDEYSSMVPLPSCSCESSKSYQDHTEQQKLLQFLLGLNETYNQAKSQILMMNPLPSVNIAYSMIVQEENQRLYQGNKMLESPIEISGLQISNANYISNKANPSQMAKGKKNWNIECEHCHLKGHKKESCYKLIGYPADFKFTKKKYQGNNVNAVINTTEELPQRSVFTSEQYEQILKMLRKDSESVKAVANASGITTDSQFSNIQWIIDTGASHHMTANLNNLSQIQDCSTRNHIVYLPNGQASKVTHIGTITFLNKCLNNVLYVPDFRFNLLSVSQLTKDLHCMVIFYPKLCVFQGLSNGTVMGIGKENKGLYSLQTTENSGENTSKALHCKATERISQDYLWHCRFGHASRTKLKNFSFLKECNFQSCKICPLAKQTRIPFSISTSTTNKHFEIVHIDVWGPYHVVNHDGARFFFNHSG